MTQAAVVPNSKIRGIQIHGTTAFEIETAKQNFRKQLSSLELDRFVKAAVSTTNTPRFVEFQLREEFADKWSPERDTTRLCEKLHLDTQNNPSDLEREILLAMLQCPIPFEFPSYDELASAVRIRKFIVEAARKTALTFATSEAERPLDYWTYSEDFGFVVHPGKSLIEALQKATQPDVGGTAYSFSCYRATEYVMALAVAQEAATCNPELLEKMQRQAEIRSIKSGEFHRVFCREYGSRENPLPLKYFVPGDRTWFRNPDSHSSDASGFEGSWIFYVGDDRFTNFWRHGEFFTLTTKCLEIFHWRHGTYRDDAGDLRMNEAIVRAHVENTLSNPNEVERILEKMLRIYDPAGVYADGGCIDISREYPRWVCPGTSDLILPDVDPAPPSVVE